MRLVILLDVDGDFMSFYFIKKKDCNKDVKRILDLILGSGRNEEEDFYGRRVMVVGGSLEKRGVMETRLVYRVFIGRLWE